MSRKTTLSPGEDGLIDPALTLPNALPSLSDYERAEPVLAALQGQIKTLRAAHAIELFARAFVDFPWVDGFDIETFNDSVSATPFAWLPDGSTAAIDQIAVAFERVAAEKTRSGPNPAAPSTPERDVYSDDIDDLLNALAKLLEGDEGFTPNIGSSPPSARQRHLSQSLPRLEGLVDADAARRAGQAFQEAARRLFSGTPSLAQPVQARVERADAVGVAMALQLPQVGSAIEAAKLRQQALKASSAGKAARL